MNEVITWSGWVGGIAVGAYLLFQYWLTGRALGVSTAYGNVCALGSKQPFFRSGAFTDPTNWRLWFFLGLPLGGAIALLTSPGASFEPSLAMGPMYEQVLPSAVWARGLVLIGGGVLIGYGARMAGGCPSGHSINGMSVLNPPSYVASAGFFAGGILSVQLLFGLVA